MDRSSQCQRLLQVGAGLLLITVLLGLAIPHFAAPRIALSAHLIGLLQGILLLAPGLLWARFSLTPMQCAVAFWLVVYQALAAFLSNVLAAAWGAGNSIIPLAAGAAHGTVVQESIINVGLRSAGAALIAALVLLLWGLRRASAG